MESSESITDVDWTIPTAVVFGNEHKGVSEEALRLADLNIIIPMSGMVESFNISVAAALTLFHVARDRVRRMGSHGDLTEEQVMTLQAVTLNESWDSFVLVFFTSSFFLKKGNLMLSVMAIPFSSTLSLSYVLKGVP